MTIDWPRLIRALTGQPEPVSANMDSLRNIIAKMGAGKTDVEQCKLWYDIEQMAFNELGEVYLDTWPVTFDIIVQTLQAAYPGLQDLKCPDSEYWATDLTGLQKLLTRDWTNLVPYVVDKSDCDKYGNRLYEHCCRYYGLNTVFPVWGNTAFGYHGFNAAVLKNGDAWIARLIEPQTDNIFIDQGPLGKYSPDTASQALGIINPDYA